MRINPIDNNYNFKGKQHTKSAFNAKFTAGAVAAFIGVLGFGYLKNKEVYDEFFKEEKQERIDNLKIKPEIRNFDSHEEALNYAFDRILPWINDTNPREYCVRIDNKTHNILNEFRGLERSVNPRKTFFMLAKQKFCDDFTYTTVHGHPGQDIGGTTTFSDTDLETFLKNDFCTEDYVLSKDRKYCRLKKEDNYRKPTEKEMDEILKNYSYMCDIAKPWQKTIKDKDGNVICEIIDYPSLHSALERYLEPFGISYTTTFGTYNGIKDIYEDGYHEGFKGGKLLTSYRFEKFD